jgi:hypothetical protein
MCIAYCKSLIASCKITSSAHFASWGLEGAGSYFACKLKFDRRPHFSSLMTVSCILTNSILMPTRYSVFIFRDTPECQVAMDPNRPQSPMTLCKLPSEIIEACLSPLTLRTLINCSGLHSEFNKGLDQRFQQIGRRLHEAAISPSGILSSELLCVISRVIFAAFSDWGQLAGASPLQSAAQAELNRRLAFPHPWFTITPDGTVQELQSAVKFGAWQAGHAYVEAHDNNSNSLHGCHSLEIRICMSPYPLQLIAIEICREVGMKPCIITFHLTLLEGDIKGFTAFCGAIAYLFFCD